MSKRTSLYLKFIKINLLQRKRKNEIITTRELGNYILETGCVPTPIYSKSMEKEYIVKPRTIHTNSRIKRSKVIKF